MLIDTEKKFVALVEALRLLAADRQPGCGVSENDRHALTHLIARGWSAEDAVAFLGRSGGRLH